MGENDEVGLQVGGGEAGGLGLEGFGAGGEANGEAGLDRGDAHGSDAWVLLVGGGRVRENDGKEW